MGLRKLVDTDFRRDGTSGDFLASNVRRLSTNEVQIDTTGGIDTVLQRIGSIHTVVCKRILSNFVSGKPSNVQSKEITICCAYKFV